MRAAYSRPGPAPAQLHGSASSSSSDSFRARRPLRHDLLLLGLVVALLLLGLALLLGFLVWRPMGRQFTVTETTEDRLHELRINATESDSFEDSIDLPAKQVQAHTVTYLNNPAASGAYPTTTPSTTSSPEQNTSAQTQSIGQNITVESISAKFQTKTTLRPEKVSQIPVWRKTPEDLEQEQATLLQHQLNNRKHNPDSASKQEPIKYNVDLKPTSPPVQLDADFVVKAEDIYDDLDQSWDDVEGILKENEFEIEDSASEASTHLGSVQNGSTPPIIVTALFDIGRGEWTRFTRPYDVYLDYLNHLIRVPNPIIIFGDQKVADYVRIYPPEMQARIQMIPTELHSLPFYSHHAEISAILREEQQNWHHTWPERFRVHPEAWSADYNIVVNSKSHFLYRATQVSRFQGTFFVWVDAGYSHGDRYVFPPFTWYPKLPRNQITLLQVSPPHEKVEKYELTKVYRQTRDVISGGFLAGDKPTIKRFHAFFIKTFYELLDQRKVDDDQTTLLMTIKNYRSTFNILHGGWLDAFKVVPRDESARGTRRRRRKRQTAAYIDGR